jgi:hypothetical protein
MTYRNGNYSAFYVAEPFNEIGLGANAAKDFVYYRTLQMWKAQDWAFPFIDSHEKTYNVRDGSSWEETLKPRLRERLRNSKNIILFLSSRTKASRALTEEVEYGMDALGLPVIVVYPEFDPISADGSISYAAIKLWFKVPAFKNLIKKVPSVHVPMEKESIRKALSNPDFMVQSKCAPEIYRL